VDCGFAEHTIGKHENANKTLTQTLSLTLFTRCKVRIFFGSHNYWVLPEAEDVSLLVGSVFSKYCKIVFTTSTCHWQISELGNRTNKRQTISRSRGQSSRGVAGLVNSHKYLIKNLEYRNSLKCNFGRQHYLTTVSML